LLLKVLDPGHPTARAVDLKDQEQRGPHISPAVHEYHRSPVLKVLFLTSNSILKNSKHYKLKITIFTLVGPKSKAESQSSRKPLMLFKILKHTIFFFINTVVPWHAMRAVEG